MSTTVQTPIGVPGRSRTFSAKAAAPVGTAVVGGNDSNTRLLLHFNGDNDSTTVYDMAAGGTTKVLTMVGAARVSQAYEKFGNASLLLDGGAYLLVNASTDFGFAQGDFTVECWARFRLLHDPYIWSWYLDADNYFAVVFTGMVGTNAKFGIKFVRNGVDQLGTALSPLAGDISDGFHHFAMVRSNSGKTFTLYIDGIQKTLYTLTTAVNVDLSSWPLYIGKSMLTGDTALRHMDGNIDEFRVQREAAWATAFATYINEYTPTFAMDARGTHAVRATTSSDIRGKFGLAKRRYAMDVRGTHSVRAATRTDARGTAAIYAATSSDEIGRHGVARRWYEEDVIGKHRIRQAFSEDVRGAHAILSVSYSMDMRGTSHVLNRFSEDMRGRAVLLRQYTQDVRGAHRIENTAIDLYELYHAVGAEPVLTGTPDATSATLPFTFAVSGAGVHYLVIRKRNRWNLVSGNVLSTAIELDAGGNELIVVPTAPERTAIAAAFSNTVLLESNYPTGVDGSPADEWLIYITSNGVDPDPDVDTPTVVTMVVADRLAKLKWTSPAYTQGADIRAIVRVRRSSDSRESTNVNVVTTTANAVGPAIGGGDAFSSGSIGGVQ